MGRARQQRVSDDRLSDNTEKKHKNLVPFKPGQSGNPRGRPKGARNRLGTQFLESLEADFNQFGSKAIALVRERKPEVYMRVVADLLPKEFEYRCGGWRGLRTSVEEDQRWSRRRAGGLPR